MTTSDEIATEAFETYRPLLFSVGYHIVMNPDKLAYINGQLQVTCIIEGWRKYYANYATSEDCLYHWPGHT